MFRRITMTLALFAASSALPASAFFGHNARATPPPNAPLTGGRIGANQYASEGEAKRHCPLDSVQWLNTKSGALHAKGTQYYGNTKHGAYVCGRGAGSRSDGASDDRSRTRGHGSMRGDRTDR